MARKEQEFAPTYDVIGRGDNKWYGYGTRSMIVMWALVHNVELTELVLVDHLTEPDDVA